MAEYTPTAAEVREVAEKAWDEGYWLGINRHTGPGNPYADRSGEVSNDVRPEEEQ